MKRGSHVFEVSKKFHVFTRIILLTCVVLLLLLSGFESLPLGHYGTDYLQSVEAQRTRSQIFTKDALILEYGTAAEQPQAISDMQVSLPLFIQEQNVLINNPNSAVRQKVEDAQPDYRAIVQATQAILAHPTKPVDPVQVDILVAHNGNFVLDETQVLTTISANLHSAQLYLFIIEGVFDVLLCALIVGLLVAFEQQIRRHKQSKEAS
jgi:hypothetical protein